MSEWIECVPSEANTQINFRHLAPPIDTSAPSSNWNKESKNTRIGNADTTSASLHQRVLGTANWRQEEETLRKSANYLNSFCKSFSALPSFRSKRKQKAHVYLAHELRSTVLLMRREMATKKGPLKRHQFFSTKVVVMVAIEHGESISTLLPSKSQMHTLINCWQWASFWLVK